MSQKSNSLNIELRPLSLDNMSISYKKWMSDEDINQFLESRFTNYTQDELENCVKNYNGDKNILFRGIFANNVHIGNIKLDIDFNHKFAFIGLLIGDKSLHNNGIGKKAITEMILLAQKKQIRKMLAGLYSNNLQSLSLFKSLGFSQSGLLKNHYICNGEYVDKVIMELIF